LDEGQLGPAVGFNRHGCLTMQAALRPLIFQSFVHPGFDRHG
jgi:hypothetical protein